MLLRTIALLKACRESGLDHKLVDQKSDCVEVFKNSKSYFFVNSSTPINSESVSHLVKDKDFTFKVLSGDVTMPRTFAYLDPETNIKYKDYVRYGNLNSILEDIKKNLNFPIIIKRNSGSKGDNVFLCHTDIEIIQAIKEITNKHSQNYDYIILAQEYIDIKKEYRVVTIAEKIELIYLKDNSDSKFTGNLSPLHFEGARASKVTDQELIDKIANFIKPVFKSIDIRFAAMDIALDKNNNLWLIEINSKPGFDYFIKDNGDYEVVNIYKKLLTLL